MDSEAISIELKRQLIQARLRRLGKAAGRQADSMPARSPEERAKGAPLSWSQRQLWFLDQLDRNSSAAYHLTVGLRGSGAVDEAALRRALDRIVARHEILRACFVAADGEPRQFARPEDSGMPLRRDDLGGIQGKAAREARLDEIVREEAASPIDIRSDPPVRARLVLLGSDGWALLVAMHHIATDARSLVILASEFQALYSAYREGRPDPLPALPLQYSDFAAWQHRSAEADLEFWRDQLRDAPATLPLPTRQARPGRQRFVGSAVAIRISAPLAAGIRRLAKERGVTVFTLLLAAYGLLLARLSGASDLVVGIAASNRQRPELDRLIGFFIDSLPVRLRLEGGVPLSQWVTGVQELLTRTLDHQSVPLEKIVEEVRPHREAGYNPLFQVMLSYDSASPSEAPHGDSGFEPIAAPQIASPFDLNFNLADTGASIEGALAYPDDLFDRATVERWSGHFLSLLEAMVSADASTPVGSLSILSSDERRRLVEEWSGTKGGLEPDRRVHELFEAQAARCGEAVALTFGAEALSYGELNARANRLAAWLRSRGVGPDVRVALCAERSLEMVVGVLAVLKAGGAYVPFAPDMPAPRLAEMLADSAPALALTHGAGTQRLREALGGRTLEVIDIAGDAASWAGQSAEDRPAEGLRPDHLAYVIYTSGSTGRPKGVMVEHRNLTSYLGWTARRYAGEGPIDAPLNTPLAFDAAVTSLFTPLLGGGTVHLIPEGDGELERLASFLSERREIGLVKLTPAQLTGIEILGGARDGGERVYVIGGEALAARAIEPWRDVAGTRLVNEYGPTEATVGCVVHEVAPATPREGDVPIGRPIDSAQVYILDAMLEPVPVGIAGEIHIGGSGVARGYLGRPALTAERFVPNPFGSGERLYRTGDLGRWRADGTIEFLGRNDRQVKIRGYRIELGEIEAQLASLEGVAEAVVEVRTDQRLVAYVRSREGASPAPAELREALARLLPDYMVPSAFVALDAFPLTPNGKLDRRALPEPGMEALPAAAFEAPRGEIEETIAAIWQDLLRIERVGRNDNFFELGGHSMLAVKMISRLLTKQLDLPMRNLFVTRNLAEFAAKARLHSDQGAGPTAGAIPPGTDRIRPELLPLVDLEQQQIDEIVANVRGGAANVQDIYPLGPLQEGLLFHHLMEQTGDAYLSTHHVTFQSRQRLDRFLAALQKVIDRHDSLRTQFHWRNLPAPVQVVLRSVDLPVVEHEIAGGMSAEATLARVSDAATVRLPLDVAPMLQAHIAGDPGSARWHLALLNHHIVLDHLSLEIILQEIEAHLKGSESSLPVPTHYRDYVARCTKVPIAEHKKYFTDLLADIERPTVPFDIRSVYASAENMRTCLRGFPEELAGRVRRSARANGISPAVLFHVAWAYVLANCSNQNDVVFGTVLSGRLHAGSAGEYLVGLLVNTLPFRVDTSGATPREILAKVEEQLVALFEHEQVPLAVAQQCSNLPADEPLFSTIFTYRQSFADVDEDVVARAWEGIDFVHADEFTNYPICLAVNDCADGGFFQVLQTAPEIDPDRIADYVEAAIDSFIDALESGPGDKVGRLEVMPESVRRRLVEEWNDTVVAYPATASIHELFEARAKRSPEAVALSSGDEQLSYGELDARANQLAHHLRALGVGPDRPVALCAERSLRMIVGILAILKAGGAYVPVDPSYPADRIAFMLEDVSADIVLSDGSARAILDEALAGMADRPTIVDLLADAASWEDQPRTGLDPGTTGLASDRLAYVIYTSGSTGEPKGVMVEHRSVVNLALNAKLPEMGAGSATAFASNPAFDAATWEIWATLLRGGRLVVIPNDVLLDPIRLSSALKRHRITCLWLTAGLLARHYRDLGDSFESLDCLLFGGDQCDPAILAHILEQGGPRQLINGYGPTETTTFAATFAVAGVAADQARIPIGRPIANARVYILDRHGCPVPPGAVGEICIGGAGVARGYLNRPALTAERFVPDPFVEDADARMYKTGDLARYLPDGNIEFLGRNDDQLKIRGYRVEPGEIEAHLLRHPAIREAIVVPRDDSEGNKRLIAYYVATEDGSAEEHRVGDWEEIYEQLYDDEGETPFGEDFRGWVSTYDGKPIPIEDMRGWRDETVSRIRALKPRKVLEIGVGSGLLLSKLASHAEDYWGTDFSDRCIQSLKAAVEGQADLRDKVRLHVQPAHRFDNIPSDYFDTIILNSVIQYFPTAGYLRSVIEGCLDALSPEGAIFIGDIRNFELMEVFYSGVVAAKAGPDAETATLRNRLRSEIRNEKELLISPDFFHLLAERLPRLGAVDIRIKQNDFKNELSRYRYDVVLRKGAAPSLSWSDSPKLRWRDDLHGLRELLAFLDRERPQGLRVFDLPNPRLAEDLDHWRRLAEGGSGPGAEASVDLEEIRQQIDARGYRSALTWSTAGRSEGALELLIWQEDGLAAATPATGVEGKRIRDCANNPLAIDAASLRSSLKSMLPDYMVPSVFVRLDAMPLTANGKVDRRELPAPDGDAYASKAYEAPAGAVEQSLARIWSDVLGIEKIGRRDSFFELGGHSLLAVRVISRIRQEMEVEIALTELFKTPNLNEFATYVEFLANANEALHGPRDAESVFVDEGVI